jgi:hypothetical protein
MERQGKDDKGGYMPESTGPLAKGGNTVVGGMVDGGKRVAGTAQSGFQSAGGMLGLGGKEKT